MSEQLVECIPNFSEGRRAEVIESIRSAITAVSGVIVLDLHKDADHNRSVITFAGPPQAAAEAAFAAIARAADLIDLDQHTGEHPRIGATDVVPFVPLSGVTMEDCVALARQVGRRVGQELGIPVYLYEAAATRPDRVNLENLRRGQYEGLREAIATDPDRAPDFGPSKLGKAGATVIGARAPLIAYNIYLSTSDVRVAKDIARAVRQSSGGLPYVKALGLDVEGLAQVSMNLTDFTRTSVTEVVERVRAEAARHGVTTVRSELVGLIPQAALFDTAARYLQLEGFEPRQVLETRLEEARRADSARGFLDRLAAPTAAPGGGSAAAYAGAMAAALVAMVARLTVGKKKYAGVQERMQVIAREAETWLQMLSASVEEDARAFEAVMEAMRLPKEGQEEAGRRQAAVEEATHGAAAVPLRVAEAASQVMELAAEAAALGNANALSDAASAGLLAAACLRAAALNVMTNAQSVEDREAAAEWEKSLNAARARADAAEERLRQAIASRGGLAVV
ncbi:MAG TPA: glutamate formimidoyltransferase [Anaerolineales bacterium]|nr:glutamate formimidoyltransferase [Anaerolineales bacterium]